MDPTYPLYPIFAFICFVLVLIPLPWHLQAWNTGTCMYMIWTGVVCLIQFVNSIIWHGNAINKAPIYCDIATRIVLGAGVALPACSLCIQRCLHRITNSKTVTSTKEQKIRIVIIDLCICLGFPLLIMALSTFLIKFQRIPFTLGALIGTVEFRRPFFRAPTGPGPIMGSQPFLCSTQMRDEVTPEKRVDRFVFSGHSSQRYVRLMLLSITDVVFTIAFSTWVIFSNAKEKKPYISWADTHSDFGVVRTFPSMIWRSVHDLRVDVEFDRWNIIMCALVFIAFFTFAEETRSKNKSVLAKRANLGGTSSKSAFSNNSSRYV
ncbi:fungal pheromone STE3G-protein-coupled receptor [Rickenella mellea]|uniref:Fungal pheromone STE3G-protein-coupled receptor n=1 Tax=Rickenella mellea TaxID=50990 RepID=A0A4Y7PWF8_9AGAM|nr:fungal pheromone STE3G-protein-coupled receptor [Rickenella mellea]